MKMKLMFIGVSVIILAVIAVQLYAVMATSNIEEYKYEVVEVYPDFEIRRYAPAAFSSVKINSGKYSEVSGKGFRTLAGFIFGKNSESRKIAMTSPVLMEMEDSVTMLFMIPGDESISALPKPEDSSITFIQSSERTFASLSFGGWASDKKINEYRDILFESLRREGISHTGRYYFAGYDPPFTLFNRRNEILVEL